MYPSNRPVLKIRQVGEPVLRCRSVPLNPKQIAQPETRGLIEMMRETLRDAPGVGLAAPQVGVGVQIAVIEDRAEYHRDLTAEELQCRRREPVPFHVLINPKLTVVEPGPCFFFEGCLSLAGFTAVTPRALAVRVQALDEKGRPVDKIADGWYARILQHETDHLRGRLFLDAMLPATFMSSANFQRHWSKRPIDEVCRILGSRAS